MLGHYIPLLIALIVSAGIAAAMVLGSFLLGPKKPTRYKSETYECGMRPVGAAHARFPVRFYIVALLFIVFDIETVFLYPWAVTFGDGSRAQKLFLLGEMGVFVAVLVVAYVYVLGARVLDWSAGDGPAGERDLRGERNLLRRRPPIRFGNEASGAVRIRSGERRGS